MKVRVIVNPSSGRKILQNRVNRVLQTLLKTNESTEVDLFHTLTAGDAKRYAQNFLDAEVDLVIAVGGDGTINEVINGLVEGQHQTPLLIIPAGTVNDFAFAMQLPTKEKEILKMIQDFHTIPIDIGKVNGRYFLNVCAIGSFVDVGYKTTSGSKNFFGQFAYALNVATEIPKQLFHSIPIQIKAEECQLEEDIQICLVTNSKSVAGFRKIIPLASVNDGYFDVLIIKKWTIKDLSPLLIGLLREKHLNDERVTYFQTKRIEIRASGREDIISDIDGELGEGLPLIIENMPGLINLVVPKQELSLEKEDL